MTLKIDDKNISLLLIEDNPADALLVSEMLADAVTDRHSAHAFDIVTATTLGEAIRQLGERKIDLVLMDLALPDSRGIETFLKVYSSAPKVPIVVLTGLMDEAVGFKAVQEGAQDYLVKGQADGAILARSILYAIERHRLRTLPAKNANVAGKKSTPHIPSLGMIGISPGFSEVTRLVEMVAKTTRASVLIHGETGTGKELIANSIHYSSSRKDGPFIKVNCSAIPDTLLETEMFGYEKGAFTDAKQAKKGLFELADNGTIFLDEIGDMEIRLQPKLLQVIENRAFRRVGGVSDIYVDVRVIAATNKDLEAMVREKRFRGDLYYRLKVMKINLPPLRERKNDILPLAGYFIREDSRANSAVPKRLSEEAGELLLRYDWPGNIRELKNVIEHALIVANSDEILKEHLPQELHSSPKPQGASEEFTSGIISLEELEKRYIRHVLDKVDGNKTKAAEILKISRPTLREKLK